MSTNRGIFYVSKEDLLRFARGESNYIKSISFTRDEGMYNPETNGGTQQAGFISKTGELVFPSQNGLVYLFPDNISLNEIQPFKHIESIIADGVSFNIYDPITLPAGVRNIEIRYTGISLTSPTQNQFMTKLLPTEKSYLNSANRRNRYFTFLAPGDYTFSVIASNNHGFWSDEPVNLLFTIKPYFWQTNLFLFTSVIFFLFILYVGYKMRFNMLENRKELLQKLVDERTKELQKEKENALQQKKIIENQAKELEIANSTKDKFFSIIAHDLRGAFHGIHGITEIMSEEAASKKLPNMKMYSDAVHTSSKNVNDLLTNLLSWSRLQSKSVSVDLQNVDLYDIVSKNIILYQSAIENKQITINNNLHKPITIHTDVNMTDLIIRNLISNAIKFCLQGCSISFDLGTASANTVSLIIKDSGVGIPSDKLKDIFKFSANKSTRGTQDEPGSGLGLNLCYELMQMLNGDITVESSLGKGTTFTLTFPK
jgi:signal transduction histidine kinase